MKVVIAFDVYYCLHANPGDAFWLVESQINHAWADAAWSRGSADSNSAVFLSLPGASPEDQALDRFDDVELHHPNWTEVVFSGVSITPKCAANFVSAGY